MTVENDIKRSRNFEMTTYLSSMDAMYQNALQQNGEIYEIADQLTSHFRDISAAAILSDSRIIKILRYAIAPSISQMKFGQFFGIGSVKQFENERILPQTKKYTQLTAIANKMAQFVSDRIDKTRFIWLENEAEISELSLSYAKKWTCSILSDQNANTRYRTWRKNQQEHAIVSALVKLGYTKSGFSGTVSQCTDIKIGEFLPEIRVQRRTVQKADVVFRSKKSKKLVLIEAKAVGVELDAVKRIKECCDKANDWVHSKKLSSPVIVTVIAGFFTETNILNLEASNIKLEASNIKVVWEHRLSDLKKVG